MIPYKNMWYPFYVTTRRVERHEEFLISYGQAYWKERAKFDKDGKRISGKASPGVQQKVPEKVTKEQVVEAERHEAFERTFGYLYHDQV